MTEDLGEEVSEELSGLADPLYDERDEIVLEKAKEVTEADDWREAGEKLLQEGTWKAIEKGGESEKNKTSKVIANFREIFNPDFSNPNTEQFEMPERYSLLLEVLDRKEDVRSLITGEGTYKYGAHDERRKIEDRKSIKKLKEKLSEIDRQKISRLDENALKKLDSILKNFLEENLD